MRAGTVGEALKHWLGESWRENERYVTPDDVATRLSADIAAIDGMLNQQVNEILHHPSFQKLESSWRGLAFLVRRADIEADPLIKVKMLSVKWKELERDFDRAVEFDQSQLFKKVYEEEIGSPGGEPFGLLVGDYSVRHRVSAEHKTNDVDILRAISGVAASSFCPFLCAADPDLLDLPSFADLQITRDHAGRMSRQDYLKWNALRDEEDARFLGVLLPQILMRGPYADDGSRVDGFVFDEDVRKPDGSGYLWGNPGYAYAAVVMRSFATSGWLADVRGLRQDEEGGGLVSDLPSLSFPTDSPGVIPRPVTEVAVTDALERQLSDLGLVPLCDCKDTPMAVFASGQSLQRAKKYDSASATANAKISAMLPYMLTVSRFAHYVKVIGRVKVGSLARPEELERLLHDWVMDYVTSDREASAAVKSRKPLREAEITVVPEPGKPGAFRCIMRFAPHYELDDMVGSVRLTTLLGKH
jgi:type VI secretion system ImpC/EvpB family protein